MLVLASLGILQLRPRLLRAPAPLLLFRLIRHEILLELLIFHLQSCFKLLRATHKQIKHTRCDLLGLDRGDYFGEFVLDGVHDIVGVRGVGPQGLLVILDEDLEVVGTELEHLPDVQHTLRVLVLPLPFQLKLLLDDLFLLFQNQVVVLA